MMAVWTPGSYLVREYARHLEGISAQDPGGKPLDLAKVRKNRWKVQTGGAGRVTVSYRVYSRTMSVQGNWVDGSFAMLNGAATFLTLAGSLARPHEVTLVLPPGWKTSVTGLPAAADRKPHHYVAADFDTLVDSPLYAGSPAIYEFQVDGVAALPRQRRGRRPVGRPALGPRRRSHRPGAEGVLGITALREVCLLQPADGERRRAGAQELDRPHGQPLGHTNSLELSFLAQPGES